MTTDTASSATESWKTVTRASQTRRSPLLLAALVLMAFGGAVTGHAQTVTYYNTGEEFHGPFPGWKNVKTDYGAVGDGATNDTAAIQKALDDLKTVQTNRWCVLYFPAGTYRIDETLTTSRKAHNDYLGANLVGEDPQKTILRWDGPPGKPMLRYDAWYCKVSRLTFDGRGKASGGLVRAGGFSTYCELSDLVFKDIGGIALNLGNAEREGQAEHAILRCKFLRCSEGISTINWNTLDIYIWYCLFEDCGKGIYNRMGGYQAYENVFLRSKEMDLGSMNGMCFAVVNNTSVGSKTFLKGSASNGYLRGNRVFHTTDDTAVDMSAELVLLDNTFVSRPGVVGAVINLPATSTLSVGNTFTASHWPVRPVIGIHPNAGTLKQDLPRAFDHNPKTEMVDNGCNDENNPPHPSTPASFQWNGLKDRTVVKYTLTAGSETRDAPRDFRLIGSRFPGHGWTVLDTRKDQSWTAGERREFTLHSPGAYRVYRLEMTANTTGTPGMRVAEFELLDNTHRDLLDDPDCFITGRNEPWGRYYALQQKITSPAFLPVPAEVRLPAAPRSHGRRVFEVRRATGDDAAELQTQINAAAREPAGSKPVVHLPRGNWQISRTVTLPALAEIQLVGDGVGNGTMLSATGGPGPVLRLAGPSRATLQDLDINGGNAHGVDGLVVENADQPGGRIYADQLNAQGAGGDHRCAASIRVDGLDRSDVTLIASGFGSCLSGLSVRGGPAAAAAGIVSNQVSFLTGSSGGGCRLLNVTHGGRVVGEAFWYEADWDYPAALLDLPPGSAGSVSLAAVWWHFNSPVRPMVSIRGFAGRCAIVSSSLDDRNGPLMEIKGDGSNTAVFAAGDEFIHGGSGGWPLETAWADSTTPPARTSLLGSSSATVTNRVPDKVPDAEFVLHCLEPLRAVRIDPPVDRPRGVTDVKLHRVQITGGDGRDAVRIQAGKTASVPAASTARQPVLVKE